MANASSSFAGPPVTEASLLADRQRFWHGFTNATKGVVIFMAVLLILMAIFLV